jgi:hypothetical protein
LSVSSKVGHPTTHALPAKTGGASYLEPIMKLTTKARKAMPKTEFAGPNRSFPVPDASHAANAKARASQAVNEGRMSKGQEAKIDAKANKVLNREHGNAGPREVQHPQSHAEFEKLGK